MIVQCVSTKPSRHGFSNGDCMDAEQIKQAGQQSDDGAQKPYAQPRYQTIERALEQRLMSGEYPAGSLMPTEIDLAAEFKTSRFTVRAALRGLTERGFIERRQGIGTRVITARPKARFTQSIESLEELFQIARETWFVTHARMPAHLSAEEAVRVGGREGEEWLLVTGVRWTRPGVQPICFIQSYVPMRYASALEDINEHNEPFFSLLEPHAEGPIDQVEQEVRAMPMLPEAARSLGQPSSSWALQVLRRYSTVGGVLIASFNWHPADQLTYTMRIRRDWRADHDD